jgi:hypothetical protein
VLAAALLELRPASVLAIDPAHWWSKRFGGILNDNAYSVAIDASGNVFVTGFFQGTADFGGGPLTANSLDVFLAKYNSDGTHQWSRAFGGTSFDVAYDVAVDGSGNVVIAGYFWNTIDLGGGGLTSAGGTDIFVAKFNPSGVHQWSKRFGSTNGDEATSVAVDPSGNVVLSGYFNLTVDFGGGNLTSVGFDNLFLVKFDANGVHQWSRRYGATGMNASQQTLDVAVDDLGNVRYTGWFASAIDFGGGNLTSAGLDDVFLVKLDAAGAHQWSRRFGSLGDDRGMSIDVDPAGNATMAGTYTGTVDFGGGNLTGGGGFLASYDGAGVHQLSRRVGTSVPYAVDVDAFGFISVLGAFTGTTDFGGGNLTSAGVLDVFLAQYDAAGLHQFRLRFGDTNNDIGYGLATGPGNTLAMSGYFHNTVSFGGPALTSAGVWDCFFVKLRYLASVPAVISSIGDVPNDQGGRVKVQFFASGYDLPDSPTPVTQYELYLRDDPLPMLARRGEGAAARPSVPSAPDWIYVGSVPAHHEGEYLTLATTLADSTVTNGMHYSVYFVRAATSDPGLYFDSPPDSGYSLDNLAPGVPQALALGGGVLTWDDSAASDFDYFAVYGGGTASFAAASLIGYTVSPTMDVSTDPYAYYFVTATDFSGNEGSPAVLDTSTGIVHTPLGSTLSVTCYPNPFNPTTTIEYVVPRTGRVRIDIFDASGSRVRTILDEEQEAGTYTTTWEARDDHGAPMSSGVYFLRVAQDRRERSHKMVLLK